MVPHAPIASKKTAMLAECWQLVVAVQYSIRVQVAGGNLLNWPHLLLCDLVDAGQVVHHAA